MGKPAIVTTHAYPPIPDRRFDWLAYREGCEEDTWHQGWGPTEEAAVAELLAIEADDEPEE